MSHCCCCTYTNNIQRNNTSQVMHTRTKKIIHDFKLFFLQIENWKVHYAKYSAPTFVNHLLLQLQLQVLWGMSLPSLHISTHHFRMAFRSELGHMNKFCFVALALCLGLLSCWKVNLNHSLMSLQTPTSFPPRAPRFWLPPSSLFALSLFNL